LKGKNTAVFTCSTQGECKIKSEVIIGMLAVD
jgi:hypothetical protein